MGIVWDGHDDALQDAQHVLITALAPIPSENASGKSEHGCVPCARIRRLQANVYLRSPIAQVIGARACALNTLASD